MVCVAEDSGAAVLPPWARVRVRICVCWGWFAVRRGGALRAGEADMLALLRYGSSEVCELCSLCRSIECLKIPRVVEVVVVGKQGLGDCDCSLES